MYSIQKLNLFMSILQRSILSHLHRNLSPCIVIRKIVLQELWLQKFSCYEALPSQVHSNWFNFWQELPDLNTFGIGGLLLQFMCFVIPAVNHMVVQFIFAMFVKIMPPSFLRVGRLKSPKIVKLELHCYWRNRLKREINLQWTPPVINIVLVVT